MTILTVRDAYEAYRVSRPTPDLTPWDDLGPTERAVLEGVANSVVGKALAAVERLAALETDRYIAKLEADPRKKVVERRHC